MQLKRCNGPLHNGEYVPLDQFWVNKTGLRKGKPFSRCMQCKRYTRMGHTLAGWVPLSKVRFIFIELENRVGRAEAARLMGSSQNLYQRIQKQRYIRKMTVRRAIDVLRDLRAKEVVRHRHSIRYGAKARGKTEKVVTDKKHLYRPHGDADAVTRSKYRLDSTA